MNKKAYPLFIGFLLLALNAFSNSDSTGETNSNRSENPVSTEGLLLTDESPSLTRPENSEGSSAVENSTITIENDQDTATPEEFEENNEEFLQSDEESSEVELKNSAAEPEEAPAEESSFMEKKEEVTPSVENENENLNTIRPVENETIIVEPSTAVRLEYATKKTQIIPYSERRLLWGKFVGLSVGQFKPEDFESNFLNDTFSEIYGDDKALEFEVHMNFKRNFSFFSTGIELNFGSGKKSSDKDLIESSLETSFWKLGGQLALDNLFREHAYFVPYISAGAYQLLYKEEQAGVSNNGWTQVSFYGSAGFLFNIDWIDPVSAKDAYFESGIENTFLFVEGTYLMESANERDPNFGGIDLKAGFKVEL